MKTLLTVTACTLLLAACSKPAPTESVESLMANPERLKDVRAQCKADHAKVGDALCNDGRRGHAAALHGQRHAVHACATGYATAPHRRTEP